MNLLIINDHGIYGGGTETRVRILLESFLEKKMFKEIHILQKYPDKLSDIYHQKNPNVIFHVIGHRKSAYFLAKRIIREQNIHFVQAHNLLAIQPYALLAAKQADIPVVWWSHDYWLLCAKRSFIDPFNAKKDQLCMISPEKHSPRCMSFKGKIKHRIWKSIMNSCVTAAISPSKVLQEIHESEHILNNKWKVIIPWIDPLFLQKKENTTTMWHLFKKKKNETFLLFVGSLIEFKGAWVAAAALKTIVEKFPHTKLLFIGTEQEPRSRYRRDIEQQCICDGTQDNILFLGKKSKEEILHIYKLTDAYLCPTVCMESFGLNWAEAMAAGLPVIASVIGSIPEYIQQEKTGILFPARDHQALAHAVITLLSHKKLAKAIGHAGAAYAKRYFTDERASKEVIALYAEILIEKQMKNKR